MVQNIGSYEKSAAAGFLTLYKHNAFSKKISWDLSFEEGFILINGDCFYCKIKPNHKYHISYGDKSEYLFSGIDRMNSNKRI